MQPLRPLSLHDVPRMVEINEQGLPGTGKVTEEEMADLLSLSEFAMGLENQQGLAGFVLCLMPKTRYGSLNYKWFNERYDEFLKMEKETVHTGVSYLIQATELSTMIKERFVNYNFDYHNMHIRQMSMPSKVINKWLQ